MSVSLWTSDYRSGVFVNFLIAINLIYVSVFVNFWLQIWCLCELPDHNLNSLLSIYVSVFVNFWLQIWCLFELPDHNLNSLFSNSTLLFLDAVSRCDMLYMSHYQICQ